MRNTSTWISSSYNSAHGPAPSASNGNRRYAAGLTQLDWRTRGTRWARASRMVMNVRQVRTLGSTRVAPFESSGASVDQQKYQRADDWRRNQRPCHPRLETNHRPGAPGLNTRVHND